MLVTQLCDTCKAVPIEETLRELTNVIKSFKHSQSAESELQEESLLQSWYKDLSDINQSSSSCQLCKLVLQGLRADRTQLVEDIRHSGDWSAPPKDFDDDIVEIQWYSEIRLEIVASLLTEFERKHTRISAPGNEEKLSLHALVRVICGGGVQASWDGYGEIKAELRISCKAGQTAGQFEIDRTVESNPLSKEVSDHLRFWLSVCSREHQDCHRTNESAYLPTRVLDIRASEQTLVYLHEQVESSRTAPYAALSHCWGLSQPFTTTIENLQNRKDGIRIAELPQTFQDAIIITRELGIRYIWIDSLCIIQNDPQDWQRESARMMMIYSRAKIVIGASNATADSEGFLHPRQIEAVSLDQDTFSIKLLPPGAQRLSTTSDPVKAEPLSTRAWCLQERYLPYRMLLVGKQQMYWECSKMLASEDGDCVARNGGRVMRIRRTADIGLLITNISGHSPQEITEVNYFGWYEMVKEYARRHISKESDRLPALTGLAMWVFPPNDYNRHDNKYMAGIWQKGLIEGLLWCRADGEDTLSNPVAYRAPSWSWASVNGAINFPVYNFYDRCKWKAIMANFEPLISYLDSYLEPSGETEFGGIKDGWLKLRGPLLPIISVTNFNKISYAPPEYAMNLFRSTACDKVLETKIQHNGKIETIYLDGGFDTAHGESSQGKLFALLLARLPDPQSLSGVFMDIRFGIILEVLAPNKYRRIGIVDGVVKFHRTTILSRISGKVHLENYLWKQREGVGEDKPNLQGPDPFGGLEQTVVTII